MAKDGFSAKDQSFTPIERLEQLGKATVRAFDDFSQKDYAVNKTDLFYDRGRAYAFQKGEYETALKAALKDPKLVQGAQSINQYVTEEFEERRSQFERLAIDTAIDPKPPSWYETQSAYKKRYDKELNENIRTSCNADGFYITANVALEEFKEITTAHAKSFAVQNSDKKIDVADVSIDKSGVSLPPITTPAVKSSSQSATSRASAAQKQ